jgi:mannitol-1-phosphate 5-dehydrogenase
MAQKTLLVYGAGAIGRGYIPWVFVPEKYRYYYVETQKKLRELLNRKGKFTTLKTRTSTYQAMEVPVERCYAPGQEKNVIAKADAIITAVGPRNILSIVENLRNINVPVICFENDDKIPEFVNSITCSNKAVFGIPDVITSNTAPAKIREKDCLAVVTEDGLCYVDSTAKSVGGNCHYIGRKNLAKQWQAKLHLHNTTHCIAAYLGSFISAKYLHQAMQNITVRRIVRGAMDEMKQMLKKKMKLNADFVDWYAGKELRRFSNRLLFDPVSRVAREPFRKLAHGERLIGAAELCLACNIIPENVLVGIMAAFCYNDPNDADAHIRYLVSALKPQDFLKIIMNLRPNEALFELLLSHWDRTLKMLRNLK